MSRTYDDLERRSADVAARKSIRRRRPRPSPFGFVLLAGAVASVLFLGWTIMMRDASLATYGAALVALAAIYLLIAVFAAVMTYRAGSDGHGFRSLVYALVGGVASIIGFVALGLAIVTLSQ